MNKTVTRDQILAKVMENLSPADLAQFLLTAPPGSAYNYVVEIPGYAVAQGMWESHIPSFGVPTPDSGWHEGTAHGAYTYMDAHVAIIYNDDFSWTLNVRLGHEPEQGENILKFVVERAETHAEPLGHPSEDQVINAFIGTIPTCVPSPGAAQVVSRCSNGYLTPAELLREMSDSRLLCRTGGSIRDVDILPYRLLVRYKGDTLLAYVNCAPPVPERAGFRLYTWPEKQRLVMEGRRITAEDKSIDDLWDLDLDEDCVTQGEEVIFDDPEGDDLSILDDVILDSAAS